MEKRELKERVEDYLSIEGVHDARVALEVVLQYIDQLDEPEITEEQAWNKIAETLPVNSAELKEGITRVAFSNPINLSAWEAVTGKTDFEPTKPIRLNDFVKRLNEIGEHNRDCWINSILRNFGNEYRTAKYQAGYEQGIFDGTMESKEKELVEVPQFVADWIEKCKDGEYNLFGVFDYAQGEVKDWIFNEGIKNKKINLVARAWLDGYTIEPSKTLQVIVKNYDSTVYKTELPEDEAMKLIEGWKGNENL